MADFPFYKCGELQIIKHIVESCPNTKFEEGLAKLHEGGPVSEKWLKVLVISLRFLLLLVFMLL